MNRSELKKVLDKQLKLLAEASEQEGMMKRERLVGYTDAIVKIADSNIYKDLLKEKFTIETSPLIDGKAVFSSEIIDRETFC